MFLASTDLVNLSWSQTFPSIISIVSEFQLIEPKKQAHRYVSHKTSVDQWLSIFYYIKAFRNTQNILVLTYLKKRQVYNLITLWTDVFCSFTLWIVANKTENRVRHSTLATGHSKSKSDPNLSSLLLIF